MRSILSTCALVATASAHTIFQELYVNGVSQGHTTGIRVPSYDGYKFFLRTVRVYTNRTTVSPITDITSDDVICNGGVNPLNTPLPTAVLDVRLVSFFNPSSKPYPLSKQSLRFDGAWHEPPPRINNWESFFSEYEFEGCALSAFLWHSKSLISHPYPASSIRTSQATYVQRS